MRSQRRHATEAPHTSSRSAHQCVFATNPIAISPPEPPSTQMPQSTPTDARACAHPHCARDSSAGGGGRCAGTGGHALFSSCWVNRLPGSISRPAPRSTRRRRSRPRVRASPPPASTSLAAHGVRRQLGPHCLRGCMSFFVPRASLKQRLLVFSSPTPWRRDSPFAFRGAVATRASTGMATLLK